MSTVACMDDLLLLLRCPLCPDNPLLSSPTTLRCGHSLCLLHFAGVPVNACPIPSCSMAATDNFVQNMSRVLLLPPRAQPSIPRLPLPTTDFTLAKLLSIVAARSSTDPAHLFPPVSDDEEDPESDSEPEPEPERATGVHSGRRSREARSDVHSRTRPRKRLRRHSPPTVPLPLVGTSAPPDLLEVLSKEILQELNCEICYTLFLRPVTTPCQHTFCAKCLQRSLDHSNKCPVCRQELPPYSYFHDQGVNKVILSVILKLYPTAYTERQAQQESEERDARLKTPIFVCQLSFPGMPTLLHFFEPRYRLMLRRCLEQPTPAFGMIMPPAAGAPNVQQEYGTMLEIRSVQMLPDGRSMVETWGTYRFRIIERSTLDGYVVGRVEKVVDFVEEEDELFAALQPSGRVGRLQLDPSNEELMNACRAFLDQLRNGMAPWVVQRLNHTYGPEPRDIGLFTFWMALIIPVEDKEKAKLLPIRSPRLRLRLIVHWIEQLNGQWWFMNGCVIS